IRGIVPTDAFLIRIHLQDIFRPIRIMLQPRQTFQQPLASPPRWCQENKGSKKREMVGAVRFELTTSCTRNTRASQATLRPEQGENLHCRNGFGNRHFQAVEILGISCYLGLMRTKWVFSL